MSDNFSNAFYGMTPREIAKATKAPALKLKPGPHIDGTETQLVKSILAVVALRYRGKVLLHRNNTGAHTTDGGRFVRYGLGVGSADLVGVLLGGRYMALECKTKQGRVSPEQTRWLADMRDLGAVAEVVRSVDEACAVIDAALQGVR